MEISGMTFIAVVGLFAVFMMLLIAGVSKLAAYLDGEGNLESRE